MGIVIEMRSDTSLHEAIKTLAKNRILSAPVQDVDAPQDASWMDKYLGVIEFAGITHWVLQQVIYMFFLILLINSHSPMHWLVVNSDDPEHVGFSYIFTVPMKKERQSYRSMLMPHCTCVYKFSLVILLLATSYGLKWISLCISFSRYDHIRI